jgi:hypothetical protein
MSRGRRSNGALGLAAAVTLALGLLLDPAAPGAPAASGAPAAGIQPFTAGGDNAAAIQGAVDAFRGALGPLNANTAGSLTSGRREIHWDGVPDALSAPNNLPANFFNVNSPRGVVFGPAGTTFQVSATAASGVPVRFGNIHPTYSALFSTFSPDRLFTAVGTAVLDVDFFVPGATTPATVGGFGAVFTNVDTPNTTRIQYFNRAGTQIGEVLAPPGQLSFAGGQVDGVDGRIARVRITNGNAAPGPLNAPPAVDVVVMGDFIYGEPQATTSTTTTTLSVVPSTARASQPVTFTATVAGTVSGIGAPSGLVAFRDNGVQIGTGTLTSTGQTTFVTTTLAPGTHSLTATYLGDGTFAGSSSTAVSVVVAAAPTATPIPANPTTTVIGPGAAPPPLPPPPPIVLPLPPPVIPVPPAPPGPAGPIGGPAPADSSMPLAPPPASGAGGGAPAPGAQPTTGPSPQPPTAVPSPTPAPAAIPTAAPEPRTPDSGASLVAEPAAAAENPGAPETSDAPTAAPEGGEPAVPVLVEEQ